MAQAYCVKCKKKTEIKNPEQVTLKNKQTAQFRAPAPSAEPKYSASAASLAGSERGPDADDPPLLCCPSP